jgi:hypothetical protein
VVMERSNCKDINAVRRNFQLKIMEWNSKDRSKNGMAKYLIKTRKQSSQAAFGMYLFDFDLLVSPNINQKPHTVHATSVSSPNQRRISIL